MRITQVKGKLGLIGMGSIERLKKKPKRKKEPGQKGLGSKHKDCFQGSDGTEGTGGVLVGGE